MLRVEGELVGFGKFAREGVEVNVNTTIRVDIALAIGELSETVLASGEAPMLQTDRTDQVHGATQRHDRLTSAGGSRHARRPGIVALQLLDARHDSEASLCVGMRERAARPTP